MIKQFAAKLLLILITLLVCCAVAVLSVTLYLHFSEKSSEAMSASSWTWLRDESYLVDVNLHSETGTAEILYSFCFSNLTDAPIVLTRISASFSKKDLAGWMAYESMISGKRLDGEYDTLLPPHETVHVVFSFTGKYLGGKINTNIAPPEEILYMCSFP